MPFIRGRYHINPIAGAALEAARQAEELAALEGKVKGGVDGGEEDEFGSGAHVPEDSPIHRIEIESAEMVPSHTGSATRGFVAHVHRGPVSDPAAPAREFPSRAAVHSTTHVFADHRDLLDFLRDALDRDSSAQSR